jgi:hypothetical protein
VARARSRTLLAGLAAAVTVAALPAGASAQAGGSKLFLQQADAGTLRKAGGGFVLTLRRPAATVVAFTDRPARRADREGLRAFVRAWPRRFRGSAPNAAVEVRDAPGHRDVMVLTLSRPRLSGRTLTFRARRLTGRGTAGVRAFIDKADRRLPRRFGHVDLFIDSAGDDVIGLEFQVTTPTQDVTTISLTGLPGQLPLGFSTNGPATVDVAPGVVAIMPSNPFTAPITAGVSVNIPQMARVTGSVLELPTGATLTGHAGDGPTRTLGVGRFSLPTTGGP